MNLNQPLNIYLFPGSIGDVIKNPVTIDYANIPDFPRSTVEGHRGRFIFGYISKVPVICMQGRFHHYEGYALSTCVMPVRLMKLLGVTHLIASNAAGGISSHLRVGDIMLIKDHLNFMGMAGVGPLVGPHDPKWGPRFFLVTDAYDPKLIENTKIMSKEIGLEQIIKEGVYTCMGGSNFESIADNRALKILGVDAVGMSTIHEVIAARQCGITCLAFSLITNLSPTSYSTTLETGCDEVLEVGKSKEGDLKVLIENVVKLLSDDE